MSISPTATPWRAIAAMAENRVIGLRNALPWHLPEDFRWFKEATRGGTLLMGRRTYESIGRPLPGRTTVVLTRGEWRAAGVEVAASLDELRTRRMTEPVFVCGGAEIYRQALPDCLELLLTRVEGAPEGDAWFPPFESLFDLQGIVREGVGFKVERWTRRAGNPDSAT